MLQEKAWFVGWFDTKYYHMLYKNRDEDEARFFVDNLLKHLSPTKDAVMLDLACGKGRHSIYLAQKGYEVTGVDLSVESIKEARKSEQANLSFFQHDMRDFFRTNYFDLVFNLFTSFGYFETHAEHIRTLRNITLGLKSGGRLVLDFFNTAVVLNKLVPHETKNVENTTFNINREHKNGKIIKSIEFTAEGQDFRFQEKVQAFTLKDMRAFFGEAGLEITQIFGDYALNEFQAETSPRLILIGKKA